MFNLDKQKGAMFGLDARIALAIFGALSVIAGAALHNAIKDAKVTAVIQETQEILKAMDSYYIDTGTIPSRLDYLLTEPAITGGVPGWNGPYSSLENNISSLYSKVVPGAKIFTTTLDEELKSCSAGETCTQGLYLSITTYTDDQPQILKDVASKLGVGNYYLVSANLGASEGTPRYHYLYMRGNIPRIL